MTENESKPPRRIPWGAVLSLVGTVILTVGLVLIPFDASRFGNASYGALFIITLLTNATVILPAPGIAAVMQFAKTLNPLLVGVVAGIAAGLGESTGWLMGRSSRDLTQLDKTATGRRVVSWVQRRGTLTVFVLAAIPLPVIDLAGLAAGAMGMPWWRYVGACMLGKTVRFTLVAYLVQYAKLRYLR